MDSGSAFTGLRKDLLRKILDDLENTTAVYNYNDSLDNAEGEFHQHVTWLFKNKHLELDPNTKQIRELTDEGRALLDEMNMELGYAPRRHMASDAELIGVHARDAHDYAFDQCMEVIDRLIDDHSMRGDFSLFLQDGIWVSEDPGQDEIRRDVMEELEDRGFECEFLSGHSDSGMNGLSVKWSNRPPDPVAPTASAPVTESAEFNLANPFEFADDGLDAADMAAQMAEDQADLDLRRKRKAELAKNREEIAKEGADAGSATAPLASIASARAAIAGEEMASQVLNGGK